MLTRLALLLCTGLFASSSVSGDLIFTLQSPQITGAGTAYVDLMVESGGSDSFYAYGYFVDISAAGSAPATGLKFANQVNDEDTNSDYVFFGKAPAPRSFLGATDQQVSGTNITTASDNIDLDFADGQKLVARLELSFDPALDATDQYTISLDESLFVVGEAGGGTVNFTADSSVSFSAAAVPEPASIAFLLVIVGGATWKRRAKKVSVA